MSLPPCEAAARGVELYGPERGEVVAGHCPFCTDGVPPHAVTIHAISRARAARKQTFRLTIHFSLYAARIISWRRRVLVVAGFPARFTRRLIGANKDQRRAAH